MTVDTYSSVIIIKCSTMDFIVYLLLTWKSYLPRDISVLDI